MVIFTILLLEKHKKSISLPPLMPQTAISEAFVRAIGILDDLDQGNVAVERCCWCLKKLCMMLGASGKKPSHLTSFTTKQVNPITDSHHDGLHPWPMLETMTTEIEQVPSFLQDSFKDQGLSFLEFDFMGNAPLEFMEGYDGAIPPHF